MSRSVVTGFLLTATFVMFVADSAIGATVGYWRFEEGVAGANPTEDAGNVGIAGGILDSSGEGNHGTAVQVADLTYSSSVPGPIVDPGALSNTLSMGFKGDSGSSVERILVADDDAFDNGLTGLTLEAFVNPFAHATRNSIINKWSGGGGVSYIFRLNASGQLQFFINDGSSTASITSTLSVPLDEWSHVAATWSDSDDTMRVYVNGVADAATDTINSPNNSNSEIRLGASDGGTDDAFKGMLDEIRISNVALSPSEFLTAVPEPTSLVLLISCVGVLAFPRRRN